MSKLKENIAAQNTELTLLNAAADVTGVILIPGGKVYKMGLQIDADMDYARWGKIAGFWKWLRTSKKFFIGDWLNFGETIYGEAHTQAINDTGYDKHTLDNMKYIAGKVELSRRREDLSFEHHAEVAALPPSEQVRWLEIAATTVPPLTVKDLRASIDADTVVRAEDAPPKQKAASLRSNMIQKWSEDARSWVAQQIKEQPVEGWSVDRRRGVAEDIRPIAQLFHDIEKSLKEEGIEFMGVRQ